MIKRILTLTLIAVMTVMLIPSAQASWTMYVSPAAGTTVNLRSTPQTKSNNLITKVPYGTALTVKYVSNGWACIDYNVGEHSEGFMMVKYLTNEYVAPTAANMKKKTTNTDTAGNKNTNNNNSQKSTPADLADHFTSMNAQFRSFRKVDKPYLVYGKPSRATGWVNLRYAPDEKAEQIRKVRQNDHLTVIGETSRWYQVEDPETGIIGYISRNYVSINQN